MSTLTFADTHNMVAFLEKPTESDGFHEIIDFLNANQIYYALTINHTIYTSCIEQFWATAKAKTVNGKRQLQALVDKKKVIITETSIRSDLHLENAGGVDCLPTATIFEELARMGEGKDFSGRVTPLFATMMIQANQEEGVDSGIPTATQQTPITIQPSISKPQKKQSRRKQKTTTAVPHPSDSTADIPNEESMSTHSNDPLLNGEDRLKLIELMDIPRCIPKEVSIDAPFTTVVPPPSHVITEVQITLAQTLTKLKSVKSKVVIQEPVQSTATTAPSTIPKAKGITFRDADERTPTSVSSLRIKDKGKAKMDEPEVPLKKKDQIALNEEMAKNLKAQLQVELIKEERLARKKEEEANIVLIES
ncbi:hypothetical protein Tco_0133344 [Tanacetum coccineum]